MTRTISSRKPRDIIREMLTQALDLLQAEGVIRAQADRVERTPIKNTGDVDYQRVTDLDEAANGLLEDVSDLLEGVTDLLAHAHHTRHDL
ncbi:MAG: hypothetical protein U1E41_09440 [Paracoccus sp. (in: a-proteobacteria)]|jgi:hypothetical protein